MRTLKYSFPTMPENQSASVKVLVVDDDQDILMAAQLLLKQYVALVHAESNPEQILMRMAEEHYDVIFLDMNFSRDLTSGQDGI